MKCRMITKIFRNISEFMGDICTILLHKMSYKWYSFQRYSPILLAVTTPSNEYSKWTGVYAIEAGVPKMSFQNECLQSELSQNLCRTVHTQPKSEPSPSR